MDVDGLPIIGPGVDYTQVGAIHQKRTLAFINHFISNTVSFLNKFSRSCELRLEKFETELQKLEASLSILETKLSSISGLENVTEQQVNTKVDSTVQNGEVKKEQQEIKNENVNINQIQTEPKEEQITAAHDPQYSRFFRMVQVGVPIQAVRLKMQAEGVDPSILDNPDMPVSKRSEHIPPEDHSDNSFSD